MNKKIAGNCSVYCEGLCKITNEKISLYKKRKELIKMNIAIVDDSREDREKLRGILEKYADAGGEKFNIEHFESAEALLDNYQPFLYAILFLDIYMDGMTGMQAAEIIRKTDGDIILIFLTTSEEHYVAALHNHAFDYIEKPADQVRVFRIMDDILKKKTELGKSLSFSVNRTEYHLALSDIVAVSASSHKVEIYDKCGNTYTPRLTFSSVSDEIFQDKRFLLVIRGVIVNMDFIQSFRNGVCYLESGIEFPCNLRKEKQFVSTWQNYIFQKLRKEAMDRRQGAKR